MFFRFSTDKYSFITLLLVNTNQMYQNQGKQDDIALILNQIEFFINLTYWCSNYKNDFENN